MTYDECMARLRAIEPLPVGERLARWLEADSPGFTGRTWLTILLCDVFDTSQWWEGEDLYGEARIVRAYARPLRHARERARKAEQRMLFFQNIEREAEDVLDSSPVPEWSGRVAEGVTKYAMALLDIQHLRAALDEAVVNVHLRGGFCSCLGHYASGDCKALRKRIRAIAEGGAK